MVFDFLKKSNDRDPDANDMYIYSFKAMVDLSVGRISTATPYWF